MPYARGPNLFRRLAPRFSRFLGALGASLAIFGDLGVGPLSGPWGLSISLRNATFIAAESNYDPYVIYKIPSPCSHGFGNKLCEANRYNLSTHLSFCEPFSGLRRRFAKLPLPTHPSDLWDGRKRNARPRDTDAVSFDSHNYLSGRAVPLNLGPIPETGTGN